MYIDEKSMTPRVRGKQWWPATCQNQLYKMKDSFMLLCHSNLQDKVNQHSNKCARICSLEYRAEVLTTSLWYLTVMHKSMSYILMIMQKKKHVIIDLGLVELLTTDLVYVIMCVSLNMNIIFLKLRVFLNITYYFLELKWITKNTINLASTTTPQITL